MFVDLLNSYNYLMVNMSAIKIFGLNIAVYSAELLNDYKRAYMKKKLIDDKYFEVNRKFIKEQTSLTEEEQLSCDLNLKKINLIYNYKDNPNIIYFDFETFASLISSEDMTFIKNISKAVKISSPKGTKETKKQAILENLKKNVNSDNETLNNALCEWIEAVFSRSGWASKKAVEVFQQRLHEYTNGDLKLALKLVEIATINGWKDCQWAINSYEQDLKFKNKSTIRITKQKVATKDTIGEESF